ncbi:hypothetical protein GEMRC1_003615 [Eukaryota sp. GEM-RC1]
MNPLSSFSALPPPLPLFDFSAKQEQPINPPNTGIGSSLIWPALKYPDHPIHRDPTVPVRPDLANQLTSEYLQRSLCPQKVLNRVVYDSLQPPPNTPTPPVIVGNLPPWYHLVDEDDATLVFESRFESGNLRRAVQVFVNEYDLILKTRYGHPRTHSMVLL